MRGVMRCVLGFAVAAAACAPAASDRSAIEETTAALSVCDEVVPANRFVDGIPAYAQCTGFENAAIYSNNGVDTSTTSLGADWIRTQASGGYQCTELAHRYLYFRWNVTWLPRGNAGEWCNTQPTATSGVVQTTVPVHGDLIVFAPGVCGADATTGHVAVVDVVDGAKAQVTIVEENRAGRRNAAQSCATCYLHVVANDGSGGSGGAGGSTGAAGTTGTTGVAGTSGTAGTTGTAGTAGTTGTAGTSGTAGTTGTAGSGGAPVADAGSPTGGAGGATNSTAGSSGAVSDSASGGCSVAANDRYPSRGWLIAVAAVVMAAARRARRRRAPRPSPQRR